MSNIRYLNVDLDIESREPLEALIADLGEEVDVLYHGQSRGLHEASFELPGITADAESTITEFCTLLFNLGPEAMGVWERAVSRTFDIGFESGDAPRSFRAIIHPDTVRNVADLNAAVIVTIYPRSEDDG
ncbi:MAG: hypothetical protein AAGF84_07040 [Planctomycetota bacterium]